MLSSIVILKDMVEGGKVYGFFLLILDFHLTFGNYIYSRVNIYFGLWQKYLGNKLVPKDLTILRWGTNMSPFLNDEGPLGVF